MFVFVLVPWKLQFSQAAMFIFYDQFISRWFWFIFLPLQSLKIVKMTITVSYSPTLLLSPRSNITVEALILFSFITFSVLFFTFICVIIKVLPHCSMFVMGSTNRGQSSPSKGGTQSLCVCVAVTYGEMAMEGAATVQTWAHTVTSTNTLISFTGLPLLSCLSTTQLLNVRTISTTDSSFSHFGHVHNWTLHASCDNVLIPSLCSGACGALSHIQYCL